MPDKVTIGVPIGCRSDEAVTMPIVKELEKKTAFRTKVIRIEPGAPIRTANMVSSWFVDFMLCVADRTEMLVAASVAHANGVPIGHVYAGTGSNVATLDDLSRHAITMLSEIQFCESRFARSRVINMMTMAGLTPNTHVVGITHFDDVDLVGPFNKPFDKYTLVLYNPLTHGQDLAKRIVKEIKEIIALVGNDKEVYLIGSNPDLWPDETGFACEKLLEQASTYKQDLPRPEFLALLAGCDRFITNSSAGIYEAPVLMKGREDRIIMIGERNRDRDRGPFETGASKKIADILEVHLATR
jgi:UDP-N-acetylglucosamine 2-epimerase